ncbi:PREDICTED: heterogeneous nuclear ribonucleoprotein 1 [Tarenaya hassleriana]|uniref:heterogeneous nuclear ribonucleoprotein 1 n=1 Tax=Tarenaya hassleriana TaxID=28532 RepID=UPI00053C81D2|nr:PREDICTED: heterogeneous nuclear ribonucleoprotein 1 [Tarenaya hassleriana]
MDYDSHRGGHDYSYNTYHRQDQQRLSSEYGVHRADDWNNDDNPVDTGENRMKHSVEHRHTSSSTSSSGKLFVGGVSWQTTEESFAEYFLKFGELVDCILMTDRMTGKPRGFGFVTFADSEVAEKVLEEEHVIDGRKVDLKRTVPRDEKEFKAISKSKTKKIFVGGLPPSLKEDELKEYFSFYGDITEHQIMYDHNTGRSRGFGFVTFQTEESVDRIISEGKIHELGDKQVEIKRAEPRRNGRDYGICSHEEGYFEKANGDYSMYAGYGGYGTYPGNYMGGTAGYAYGYGGYGYGYGYGGGSMYNFGYGAGGYSQLGGYGSAAAYGGAEVYRNDENSSSSVKGNVMNGSAMARYHPYQRK